MTYMYTHFVPANECGDATETNQNEILARTDALLDLLQADQVVDSATGNIKYFLKGSGQTVLLHEQTITGNSSCASDVSLIAP